MANENNHGGLRTPRPGKTNGRPKDLKHGPKKKAEIYIGENIFEGMKAIDENRSEAITRMYEFWQEHHPNQ